MERIDTCRWFVGFGFSNGWKPKLKRNSGDSKKNEVINEHTPWKTNIDTKNDGFLNLSFKYSVILGIQPLVFGGVLHPGKLA